MHDIIIVVLVILLVIAVCYIMTRKQIDMYTSAQPPPPFSTDVSSNIVYPDNMQIKQHPIPGVDCTGTDCDTVYSYYGYPYTGYYGPYWYGYGGAYGHGGHGGHGSARGHRDQGAGMVGKARDKARDKDQGMADKARGMDMAGNCI